MKWANIEWLANDIRVIVALLVATGLEMLYVGTGLAATILCGLGGYRVGGIAWVVVESYKIKRDIRRNVADGSNVLSYMVLANLRVMPQDQFTKSAVGRVNSIMGVLVVLLVAAVSGFGSQLVLLWLLIAVWAMLAVGTIYTIWVQNRVVQALYASMMERGGPELVEHSNSEIAELVSEVRQSGDGA